jgi:hypothetical protein
MAWFYEIRSSNNAVMKRDGGFATQDAVVGVVESATQRKTPVSPIPSSEDDSATARKGIIEQLVRAGLRMRMAGNGTKSGGGNGG